MSFNLLRGLNNDLVNPLHGHKEVEMAGFNVTWNRAG
jgi:hypothetical protein